MHVYYIERDAREGEEAENGELVRGQEEVGVSGRGEEEERRGAGEERFGPHVDESDSSEDEVGLPPILCRMWESAVCALLMSVWNSTTSAIALLLPVQAFRTALQCGLFSGEALPYIDNRYHLALCSGLIETQ